MWFRKVFLAFFLLITALAYPADDKQPPVSTPNQEQQPPSGQTPAPLPSSTEITTSYEGAFVRMLVTLLGLVFLIFATLWILKRVGKGRFKMGSGRLIQVIEKRSLSPKSTLYVVTIDNKRVLISESQVEVRALCTSEEIPDVNE